MIEELSIRGLGVIEDARLTFAPGLTVVSGETGAGKTMLVTALSLLLGARADTNLVRTGSSAASIDAVISPPPAEAAEWLSDDDELLIVSREIPADGRSRARISGRLAPVAALADVLGRHVEVHAQHEHVRLARPEVQRGLLDRFAGDPHDRVVQRYRAAYDRWRALDVRRRSLHDDARERARELDRLRAEIAEIDEAALDPEVDGELDQELELLGHAEEVLEGTRTAMDALSAGGAQEPLGIAVDALRRLPVDDATLQELTARAESLAAEATELAADVRGFADGIAADPHRLAELQDRKRTVAALTRKYGVDVAAVLAYADEARERLAALEGEDADAEALEGQLQEAHEGCLHAAEDLRRGRRAAGERLAGIVDGHLADLGMPHARFEVDVEALADEHLTADGADRITFLLAPNPGEPARSLAQAASGGERSRVSLAIEVALADVDDARVLVFDEVDAGIGGATAMAVGEKLARLAAGTGRNRRQVLCVTHLAQLAAFADVHHVVEKGIADGRTVTTTRAIGADDRVAELSRMLGGDATAAAGVEHARELMAQARARVS